MQPSGPFEITYVESTPDPGATPVLLTDLVAGWALTAGPQQTLDSTGVIASGALDLTRNTEGPGSQWVTYGASGANFPSGNEGNSNNGLYVNSASSIQTGESSWAVHVIASVRDITAYNSDGYFICKQSNDTQDWALYWFDDGGLIIEIYMYGADQSYPGIDSALLNQSEVYSVLAGYDAVADEVFLRIDDGAEQTFAYSLGNVTSNAPLCIGSISTGGGQLSAELDGTVKYARFWKGSSIPTIRQSAAWLANMSGGVPLGRTDAEIAAYTG